MTGGVLVDVFELVALVAVIVVAVVVALRAGGGSSLSRDRSTALRLLDERLARGEVDVEEYRRALEVLRHSP